MAIPIVLAALVLWNAQSVVLHGIHAYQHVLAPVADRIGIRCRFTPTCSRYAEIVIRRDGIVRGGWKTAKRVLGCGPWTRPGTFDPP